MIHRHYLYELDVRHEQPEPFSFDGAVEAPERGLTSLADAEQRRASGCRSVTELVAEIEGGVAAALV